MNGYSLKFDMLYFFFQKKADKCTTALWVAMQRRNEEVVKLLIDGNAKIDTGKSKIILN